MANTLREDFLDVQVEFDKMNPSKKTSAMGEITQEKLRNYIHYMYEHFDIFKLIICCSEGTDYANYIDSLIAIELKYTHRFFESVRGTDISINEVDEELMHILQGSYFHGLFEVIRQDMSKQKAMKYIESLTEFFNAGWYQIMGL